MLILINQFTSIVMQRLFASFRWAIQGFGYAARTQPNFRIHLVLTVLVLIASWWFKLSAGEWLWIVLSIVLVLSAELFNTSIELITDMVSPEINERAGRVKDMAAAAVTLCVVFALAVAGVIFVPRICLLFIVYAA
jgi:diacylglycerol kinase (ATP)